MIPVACPNCGMKLQVRDEFAGRSGPCPTCKHKLVIPPPESPLTVPVGAISGTSSSLDQAGPEVGATVILPAADERAEQPSVGTMLARSAPADGRYVIEREIARGGMGAVVRAIDRDIRREVAIKYMLRAGDAAQKTRFVEEAQITGQLEHPNIVPIHELGIDGKRRLFFAMKMVKGRSLAQVLDDLRKRSATAEFTWPLGKLLNVFTGICYAVSYAHSRSVIHRDLKPANIMLGDFGETYVMDWGLAKVVAGDAAQLPAAPEFTIRTDATTGLPTAASTSEPIATSAGASAARVATNREAHGDLTQDGTVMGTPAYMSPEQARGEVQRLDHRSDIYALGAILYELLTLFPPVETSGGAMELLERVAAGNVSPPESRTPERAQAGKIPRELSAIAMKAMALKPGARYQSVEAMRRDVERFQLGRAVSAKADTAWESAVKFVRRNKTVSVASLLLAAVSAVAFVVNYQERVAAQEARRNAEDNFAAFEQEQRAKNDAIRKSIPGTLRAARQLANEGAISEALAQIALVRTYQPNNAESHLLSAQIALAEKRWPAAVADFDVYLRKERDDTDALKLRAIAMTGRSDDLPLLIVAADMLQRDQMFGLAQPLVRDIAERIKDRKPLADMCRKQIHAAHPDATVELMGDGRIAVRFSLANKPKRLDFLRGLPISSLDLQAAHEVASLEPLRGMPLEILNISGLRAVSDLKPLQGMPLSRLFMTGTAISDLSPLSGMSLNSLHITNNPISDLRPLAGMPLKEFDASTCPNVVSLEPLRGMPLERLTIMKTRVEDLGPIGGAPLSFLNAESSLVSDLRPLQGMPLKEIGLGQTIVEDLEPLRGMKLEILWVHSTRVRDLSPLAGSSLRHLRIDSTSVTDVTPLADVPLSILQLTPQGIRRGMDVLRTMKSLQRLQKDSTATTPEEFWKTYDAEQAKKKN